MKEKNILIFPGGTGIAEEIWKSLRWEKSVVLYGASSVPSVADQLFKTVVNVPFITDPTWVDTLNNAVKEHHIDAIFPAHDDVLLALAEEQEKGTIACPVITHPIKTCRVTRSKSKTYNHLKDTLRTPSIYTLQEAIAAQQYPYYLKPDSGQGAQDNAKATSEKELQIEYAKRDDLLILEFLPGKEYTIDCFSHRTQGLLFCEGRERVRVRNGVCTESLHVQDPRFRQIAETLSSTLLFHGAWFFQLKETKDGDFALLEIGPRIGGTLATHRVMGMNFPLMSLFEAEEKELEPLINTHNIRIRRTYQDHFEHNITYSTLYIDIDDCLIVREHVNTDLITLLYQAHEAGKDIHVLSRHEQTYDEPLIPYLERMCIPSSLFTSITSVQPEEKKSAYIQESNSIFIDDSFQERKDVAQTCNIPTFDTSMIPLLLTWN